MERVFPAETRPLEKWLEYNNYIQYQTDNNKIDIDEDEDFNGIDDQVKALYRQSILNPDLPSLSRVIDFPGAYCLPYTLFFPDVDMSVAFSQENLPGYNIEKYNLPFSNVKNLTGKSNQIFRGLQASSRTKFDVDRTLTAIGEIIQVCKKGIPAMTLALVSRSVNRWAHMIALVFWWDTIKDRLVCGIYDPMFHVRPEGLIGPKEKPKYYIWAINQAKLTMLLLGKLLSTDIHVLNISQYCHHTPKGIHCSQYVVRAEYCSIYALYFLMLYAKYNYPQSPEILQQVVEETFISPSAALTYGSDAANKFMFVKCSFLFTVLIMYVGNQSEDLVNVIYSLAAQINEKNTFDILHPEVRRYFDSYAVTMVERTSERRKAALAVKTLGGARTRRVHTRNSKRKQRRNYTRARR